MDNFDVVIVGGGPTGLLLAIELTVAGVRPLVLERLDAPDLSGKAMSFNAVAAEALVRRGFAGAIEAAEVQVAGSPWRRRGGHFAGLSLIEQERQREPERRMRMVPQSALEAMLRERAMQLEIPLHTGAELVDLHQHEHGVTVQLRDATLETPYLVGCDGGRSTVRKRAGFDFPGTEATLTAYQAVVDLDHPERLAKGWQRSEAGAMSYGPMPGRISLMVFDGAPPHRDEQIAKHELERLLRQISGADVHIERIHHATRWGDSARLVSDYRRGRVLLAGDAAHVHPPFGGQGLGLGLIDAVNLGWKLAATVRGTASEGLLDSYSSERHPIAARVLDNTRAQLALLRPDPQTSALRSLITDILLTDWGNQFFGELISGINLRYDLGDPNPLVGTMVHPSIVSRLDGALLLDGSDVTRLAQGRVACLRREGTSMLIRPDGCIAWAGDDSAGLQAALNRWC